MLYPSPVTVARKISIQNGLFNGHSSLAEAFLSVLPTSIKDEANDKIIEALYKEVKRDLLSDTCRSQSTEHWALVG